MRVKRTGMLAVRVVTFSCVVLGGSGALADEREIIFEQRWDYVAIVPLDKAAEGPNNQPYNIDIGTLRAALRTVRFDDSNRTLGSFVGRGDSQGPVFNDQEINRLAVPVTKALNRATAQQDVIFSVSSAREVTLGRETLTTSGRLFVKDGQLNILFKLLHTDWEQRLYQEQTAGAMPKADFISAFDVENNPVPAPTRSEKARESWRLVDAQGVALQPGRADWVRIDLATVDRSRATAAEKSRLHKDASGKPADSAADRDLKARVEKLEKKIEAAPEKAATPAAPDAETGALEDRLTKLKALRDKGLISEEVYEDRMREILKDL